MRVVTSTNAWRVYRKERVVLATLIGCLSLLIQYTAIPIQFPLEPTPISEVSLAAQHLNTPSITFLPKLEEE